MGAQWLLVAVAVAACGEGGGDGGAGVPDAGRDAGHDAGPQDAGGRDAGEQDAGDPHSLDFTSPEVDAIVFGSAVVDLAAGDGIDRADVFLGDEAVARCEWAARPFICLVDVGALGAGPLTLTAHGFAGADEVATASVTFSKRDPAPDPCEATPSPPDCVAALISSGAAAGYEGLSYHDMDDGHAAYSTAGLAGIESQINHNTAGADPWHRDPARIVVANQSEAWVDAAGTLSIPRLYSISEFEEFWERSKVFLWPEHRDHGFADYYAWQTPCFVLSQGSSGSELDEVGKLLFILASLPADARDALHEAGALMPTLAMIHRRARVASDLEYVSAAAHPQTFMDAPTDLAGIRLAQEIDAADLPPVARLAIEETTIPPEWDDAGLASLEDGRYAVVWAPSAPPAAPPAGTFEAIVDLSGSLDPSDGPLWFFAARVRGDPARVRVVPLDRTRFRIEMEWPADHAEIVSGQSRTSRRTTVAFFAHDGVWLSAPAFVSVYGADPFEPAPDANNLD